ncbi:MAG: flagellar biosynthesis protein FlhA [Bacteroidota bacterium]
MASASTPATGLLGQLQKRGFNSEIAIPVGVVLVLLVMVVPLPSVLLDMLLTTNIAISLAVLLTAFYAKRPLDFAVFPGLLLITTIFRLSLNVASTRLILSEGQAGALIAAFGNFVVAGNTVVGVIIFLVLVLINFIVITKGSGRIAEVAARFTLDAMPGKQMAIDADLNAGLIDEDTAKRRRSEVSREADFFGAMDGASKYVRGDAIAGLIITAINIVGGLVIGMMQQNMSFGDAGQNFVLLSIGDGLVSQIPALLISTAAGIIVSRAGSEGDMSSEFKEQLFKKAHPLLITAAFLFLMGLIPGLPSVPFWVLSIGLVLAGRSRLRADAREKEEAERAEADVEEEPKKEEDATELLLVDPLELEIGYGLISIVDPNPGGDLLERVKMLRQQLARELGIVIPPVRIRDNMTLGPNQYIIKLRGNPIGEGEAMPNYHMVLLAEDDGPAPPGIQTTDPTFGLPAVWVATRNLHEAERLGLTVVESPAVVTTHLLDVLRKSAYQLLDRQEVQKLIDKVKESAPALIEELVPNLMTLGSIQKVLKRLLQERIPTRDLITILECLADNAISTKNTDVLVEMVRVALAPTITRQFATEAGVLYTMVIDPVLEQHLLELAQRGELNATTLGLQPDRMDRLVRETDRVAKAMITQGFAPVLLTSQVLRSTLFTFLSPMISDIAVLSYNDVMPEAKVEVIEQIKI